jgi:hypothetical protein
LLNASPLRLGLVGQTLKSKRLTTPESIAGLAGSGLIQISLSPNNVSNTELADYGLSHSQSDCLVFFMGNVKVPRIAGFEMPSAADSQFGFFGNFAIFGNRLR